MYPVTYHFHSDIIVIISVLHGPRIPESIASGDRTHTRIEMGDMGKTCPECRIALIECGIRMPHSHQHSLTLQCLRHFQGSGKLRSEAPSGNVSIRQLHKRAILGRVGITQISAVLGSCLNRREIGTFQMQTSHRRSSGTGFPGGPVKANGIGKRLPGARQCGRVQHGGPVHSMHVQGLSVCFNAAIHKIRPSGSVGMKINETCRHILPGDIQDFHVRRSLHTMTYMIYETIFQNQVSGETATSGDHVPSP